MYTLNIFKRTFFNFPFPVWIPPIIHVPPPIPKTIKEKKDKKPFKEISLKNSWSSWATEQIST